METSTQVQGCQGAYPCVQNKRNIRIFFLTLINRIEVKKGLIMKNVQNQPEKTERLISMHIKFSITRNSSKLKS